MKKSCLSLRLLICCAALCGTVASLHAANFTTAVQQAAGANWSQGIWQPGAVAPTAGNTYECVAGGNPTRLRNPTTGGVLTFPGDSLQLNTNTEIRGKIAGTALNFPGVGGNPGLILNGGNMDMGDNAVMGLTGVVLVQNPSSFTCGDSGGNNSRGWVIGAEIRGSTNIDVTKFFTGGVNAIELTGLNNPFTGTWIFRSGGFKATGSGSLGNSHIRITPTNAVTIPVVFEVMYDVNSTGSLTITNGGTMVLHQNCTWSAVTVNGTALTVGTHPYAELAASFPTVFVVAGSGSITVAAPAPPFAPLNISAVNGDTQVFLSWSPALNAAGYFINRSSTSGGAYTTVGSSGTTNFTDTGLVNGTTNYYVIVATNNLGASTNSSEVVGIPNVVVVGITAVGATNQVTLNWTTLANAASYSVLRATSVGGPFSLVASGLATTTYLDTTAASGVTYFYRIAAALTDGGQSGRSATVSATTAPGTPALSAVLFASTVIRLGWTSPDTANRQFFLERSPDGTNFSLLVASSVNQLSYTNTGLTLSNTYYYRVQASNVTGLSAYSNIASNTTPVLGLNINFGAGASNSANAGRVSPIPPGYLGDIGELFGDRTNGYFYGWTNAAGTNVLADARWRQNPISPDLRYDDFIHMMKGNLTDPSVGSIWEIQVPNGPYVVHLVCGESDNTDSTYIFDVEGVITPTYIPGAGVLHWGDMTINCAVTDGKLTIKSAPGAVNTKIAFVDIYPDIPIPPIFAVQPQTQNVEEWRPVSLAPTLSQGSARLDYQWYYNNALLVGATNRVLNFPRIRQSDVGDYYLIVTNYGGAATSAVATITVFPDVTIPTVVSVGSLDGNTVGITFSEEIDVNSGAAQEASNYQIDAGNIVVLSVSFRPDGKSVKLTLGQQITSTLSLDVLSIPDYAGNSDISSTNITPMGFVAGDVGGPALAGSNFTSDNDAVELVGGGADIWGTMDQGYLATKTVSGNFDARIKVNSLRGSNTVTKAVLVARETGNSNSAAIHVSLNPAVGRNQIEMGLRPATDAATVGVGTGFVPANVSNGWMRIVRIGDQFTGYRSTNGVDWYVLGQTNVVFPAGMQVGFGITAHDNSLLATGVVSGFSVSQISSADLAITKTAQTNAVLWGPEATVKYGIVVTNVGPDAATSSVVTDVLPIGASFVAAISSQGSCSFAAGTVTCNLGTLNAGGSATISLDVHPSSAGSLTNTATASSGITDPNLSNNSATAVAHVISVLPQLRTVSFSGGIFSGSVQTEVGPIYEIQWSHTVAPSVPCNDFDCLGSPAVLEPWFTLTNFVGDGTLKAFSDPSPAPDRRFYRTIVH